MADLASQVQTPTQQLPICCVYREQQLQNGDCRHGVRFGFVDHARTSRTAALERRRSMQSLTLNQIIDQLQTRRGGDHEGCHYQWAMTEVSCLLRGTTNQTTFAREQE